MTDEIKVLEPPAINTAALMTALKCAIYSKAGFISPHTRAALVSISRRLLDGQQVDRNE